MRTDTCGECGDDLRELCLKQNWCIREDKPLNEVVCAVCADLLSAGYCESCTLDGR